MSVKRTPRPFRNDRVEIEGDGPEERDALDEILQASTPRARITRIGKVLPEIAAALEAQLGDEGSADNTLLDDIEAAEQQARQFDVVKSLAREHNRRVNLPTAREQYQRWRELAEEIRAAKPYIKSKAEIARQIRQQLTRSHDPSDRAFIKPFDTIRKKI